jgi:PRMT5 oligomerisation domain
VFFLHRITGDEQSQHPVCDADLPYSSCGRSPWAGWLLRGRLVRRNRTQHTSEPEGTYFKGHAELVPAVLPPKGKAHAPPSCVFFPPLPSPPASNKTVFTHHSQEPLYLPSNSELQVSIWRLTDQRQVWYEWYAESFLPVLRPPAETPTKVGPLPRVDGYGSFMTATSTPFVPPSPLIDAIDNPFVVSSDQLSKEVTKRVGEGSKVETGVVKIGQTTLHNPGGRSSWIGL